METGWRVKEETDRWIKADGNVMKSEKRNRQMDKNSWKLDEG